MLNVVKIRGFLFYQSFISLRDLDLWNDFLIYFNSLISSVLSWECWFAFEFAAIFWLILLFCYFAYDLRENAFVLLNELLLIDIIIYLWCAVLIFLYYLFVHFNYFLVNILFFLFIINIFIDLQSFVFFFKLLLFVNENVSNNKLGGWLLVVLLLRLFFAFRSYNAIRHAGIYRSEFGSNHPRTYNTPFRLVLINQFRSFCKIILNWYPILIFCCLFFSFILLLKTSRLMSFILN